jgi:hypothetical protein
MEEARSAPHQLIIVDGFDPVATLGIIDGPITAQALIRQPTAIE